MRLAGHSVNTILMNKPNQTINLDNGIKQGDKVLFPSGKYLVDGSIGNLLLISNDKDDRQVTVQDVQESRQGVMCIVYYEAMWSSTCNVLINHNESCCDKHKQDAQ